MTIRRPPSCTASSANPSCCRWRSAAARCGSAARPLNIAADGAASGASKLFVRRHDMQIGPAGTGSLEGAVRHVRSFGPIQRAEVALSGGEGKTVIEIDAPAGPGTPGRRDRRPAAPPLPDSLPPRIDPVVPRCHAPNDVAKSLLVHHSATVGMQQRPHRPWGIFGLSVNGRSSPLSGFWLLAGCAADVQIPDQPSMYLSMANAGATLDHARPRRS